MHNSKTRFTYGLFLALFSFLTIGFFPGDPPGGKTGAPGDGLCTDCHAPGNPLGLDGGINIVNFPSTITPGQTYMLTASVSNPNGLAARAGFQAVVLDAANQNAGDLASATTNPTAQTFGSREYMEHRPALNFPASNQVSWDFMWTAPSAAAGTGITIYASTVIASGTNGNGSDLVVTTQANGTIEAVADPLVINGISTTDVLCFGEATGMAAATVSGGAGGYNYQWSNGMNGPSPSATGFLAGAHSVTVMDSDGAMTSTTFTINQPNTPLILNILNQTDATCVNVLGSATVQASGGTAGYIYNWPNGSNNPTQNALAAGSYIVTVADQNLCEETVFVIINSDFDAPIADAGPDQLLTCDLTSVTLNGTGSSVGTDIDYTWFDVNNVEIANTITTTVNLPGVYTLVVTDNGNGCSAQSSVQVSVAPDLILSIFGNDPFCTGENSGSIELSIQGGQNPFMIDWNVNALDGIEDPINLTAGFYSVTVTDANSCSGTASITINDPSPIILTSTITNVSCNGICDGAIDVTVSGGSGGYTYDWANGVNTPQVNNLCPGPFGLTVTDNQGCTTSAIYEITEPAAMQVSSSTTDVSCNGDCDGTMIVTVMGGVPPYNYNWPTGSNDVPQLDNLCFGDYIVTITDANNCTVTIQDTVEEPAEMVASISVLNPISCFENCDGSLEVVLTGGTGPFIFDWDNLPDVTGPENVCAGIYTLTLTDANGCVEVLQVTVTEPTALALSGSAMNVTCFGSEDGSISTAVSGGTGLYMYDWDDNGLDGMTDPSNLGPGGYGLTVTDENGCTDVLQWTITEPTQLAIAINATSESASGANDGTAQAIPSGGTGIVTYLWSNMETTSSINNLTPGNYTVTVTDENDCTVASSTTVNSFDCNLSVSLSGQNIACNGSNDGSVSTTVENGTAPITYAWSNNTSDANLNGVEAGTYTVTVMDGSNCEVVNSITLSEPSALSATASVQQVSCAQNCDGIIDLTITGGTSPYTTSPTQLNNLCVGNYAITITDANSCTFELAATVTQNPPLALIMSSTSVTTLNGNDGTATAEVSGGSGIGYTFEWNTNQTSSTITGLMAGEYCVTVTDALGCFITGCVTVAEVSCDLEIMLVTTPSLCNGENNGSAEVTSITGGEAPFSYAWSSSNNTNSIETALGAGAYTVTVMDGAGCSVVNSFTIAEPDAMTLQLAGINESAAGAADGLVTAEVTGGTAGYTYLWSSGETTNGISNLPPGEYCVTVTDNNLCEITDCYIVIEGACTFEANLTTQDVLCFGEATGEAQVTVSGGVGVTTYAWSSSANSTAIETGLAAGTYFVTVSDNGNCPIVLTFSINTPTLMVMPLTIEHESTVGVLYRKEQMLTNRTKQKRLLRFTGS